MNQPCPFCRGRGHEKPKGDLAPLVCEPCNGTGDRDAMRLLHAYRLGREHERRALFSLVDHARAHDTRPSVGLDRLRAEVAAVETEAERAHDRVLTDAETPSDYDGVMAS